MSFAANAEIDLKALHSNFLRARQAAPHSNILAVVKANAYGHGTEAVARALTEADGFGVARLNEAIALRRAGIRHKVLLLEGPMHMDELADIVRLELDLVIHHTFQFDMLEGCAQFQRANLWLKFDSGMGRLGFDIRNGGEILARARRLQAVDQPLRLMTHLANADDRDDDHTARQIERFLEFTDGRDCEISIANSGGTLAWAQSHQDWVRPGIMLYGISPFAGRLGRDCDLAPVMRLRTRLIAKNRMRKGQSVGYSGLWRCPRDSWVGIAAIGYADGLPRHTPTGTPVLINGEKAPLIGRVSMDMVAVDLSDLPASAAGDEVVLWGGELPVEEIARAAGSIPYELVCRVAPRVPRLILD